MGQLQKMSNLQTYKKLGRRYTKTSDISNIATTRTLTKVITYLSERSFANITDIRKATQTKLDKLKDALLWLKNHKLIYIKSKSSGIRYYYISVNTQQLKGGIK